uniref:Uncharacterized protein n=1 Tax=Ditylenchus dipsaci TaxID=166011 RepID=A0A915EA71_9BILA
MTCSYQHQPKYFTAVSNVRQHFCKLCQLISSADFFGSFDRSVSIAIKCRLQELIEQDPDLEITIQSQIAVDPKTAEIAEIDLECREYTLREASEAIYNRFRSRKSTSEQNDTQSASTAHSSAPRGQPPIAEAEVMEELLLGSGVPTGSTTANDRVKMRGDDLLFE